MNAWTNFFITAAGASAALAGLVIVAVSVNISRILSFPHLPARAAASPPLPALILVASMTALIPQGERWFSGCFSVGTALACSGQDVGRCYEREENRPRHMETVLGVTLGRVKRFPSASGLMLAASDAVGLNWMAGGVIAVFICSMINTWVLLVEILR